MGKDKDTSSLHGHSGPSILPSWGLGASFPLQVSQVVMSSPLDLCAESPPMYIPFPAAAGGLACWILLSIGDALGTPVNREIVKGKQLV